MATARISESLWTCTKRWSLEAWLTKAGHKWPSPRSRQPMSGAECVCRILAWMDSRCRPDGDLTDVDVAEVEFAAGWTGDDALLVQGLVETGWIDQTPEGMRWHDYGSFNGITLRDRIKKRGKRPGTGQGFRSDLVGDNKGDSVGDEVGDKVGASCPGPGPGPGPSPEFRVLEEDPQTPAPCAEPHVAAARTDPICSLIEQTAIPAWMVDRSITDRWAASVRGAYPGLDHEAEIRKAAAWWNSNPAKNRHRKSISRFLKNWIERAHEQAERHERNGHSRVGEIASRLGQHLDSIRETP